MVLRGLVKFLSGLLAVLLILGIVLGVVSFFTIRNFNPNMFRTEIEGYLSRQTGFRVELGDIKLQWRPQPQLQVVGLTIYHPQTLEKVLQSEQVRLDADLTSLWQKHFSMSQVVIQSPEVVLSRDQGGVWNWQIGKVPRVPHPVAPSKVSQAGLIPTAEASERNDTLSLANFGSIAQGWEFGMRKILVRDATVHFTDETVQPPYRLKIGKLEAEIRQKTPGAFYYFTVGATIFDSAKRNLEAEGNLDVASKALDLMLRYGPEKAMLAGKLKVINVAPHFEGTLEIKDLDMESVIPSVYKQGNYVAGRLSAKAQLSFDGANPDVVKRSLAGQGTIEIRAGALRNRNLIQEIFDRLSPVIATTNSLGGELPPEVSAMLKERDTPFQLLQVAFGVKTGLVRVTEFLLTRPNYQLTGKGTYGILDQRLEGTMQILFSESISAYLMQKIHEMKMIADQNGKIMIPFRYGGVYPDTIVQPDLPYITSRLLQGGADQLFSFGLEKLSKVFEPPKTEQTSIVNPPAPENAGSPASANDTTQQGKKVLTREEQVRQGLDMLSKILEQEKT